MPSYDESLIKGFEIREEERRRIAKGERTIRV